MDDENIHIKRRCAVLNCNINNISKNRLFKFPQREEIRKVWLHYAKIKKNIKNLYMCENHFTAQNFTKEFFLRRNAIPTKGDFSTVTSPTNESNSNIMENNVDVTGIDTESSIAVAYEIIRILEMKLQQELKLKGEIKQCDKVLKENLIMFESIFDIDGPHDLIPNLTKPIKLDEIERNLNVNKPEEIKVEYVNCSESPVESKICLKDAYSKIKELKCQLFQVDDLKVFIQSLHENIMLFEKLVCNLSLDENQEDMSFIQMYEPKIELNLDVLEHWNKNDVGQDSNNYKINSNLESNISSLDSNHFICKKLNANNKDDPLNVKIEQCTNFENSNLPVGSINNINVDHNINQKNIVKIHEKTNSCEICNMKFYCKYNKYLHIINVHKVKSLETVEKPTRDSMEIRVNAARKYNNQYICDICQRVFHEHRRMRIHIHMAHSKTLKCNICNEKFSFISRLKRHEKTHINMEARKEIYYCEICSKKFYTKSGLTFHMVKHYPDRAYQCNICNKSLTKRSYLTAHMMTQHGIGKMIKCNQCELSFNSSYALKHHINRTHEENPIQQFKRKFNQQFICEICGQVCMNYILFRQHKEVHSTEIHSCEHCSKEFTRKQSLQLHILKNHYTGETFKCNNCKGTYTSKKRFEFHKCLTSNKNKTNKTGKIHTCKICFKQFTSSSGIYRHKFIHMDIKRYRCHICFKYFAQKQNLDLHLKVHAGLKPYARTKN